MLCFDLIVLWAQGLVVFVLILMHQFICDLFQMLTLGFCSLLLLIYIFLSWIRRYIRVDNYKEKYILVTGCDSGFGQLLVQRLDMLGFNVFATCLTESAQRRLREITSSRLMTLTLDITNKEQVRYAVDKVRAALPHDKGK